jgi:hypothetical protein
MLRGNKEIWLSVLAASVIAGIYALVAAVQRGIPRAGDLFGHLIGILGFVLMLMTETLYTFRKHSRRARWGRMSTWLEFHIFTGIVGPFMVLLHTSWKFNGLAGATTLLTGLIVISGFIGRYIYTSIPRSVDGTELETPSGLEQAASLARARRLLSLWHTVHIPIGLALFAAAFVHIGAALYYATFLH